MNVPSTQAGWYQGVYIRGGDIDQVAYEFDGLPVTRQSDLAPITTLTSLGSQEVQVYTGGTPASSNSSGLAGYINQVIKTGTHPGYATGELVAGGPAFFHEAKAEVSGATPDRLFSYYVGLAGSNQDYRYGNQFNGAGVPQYFYPVLVAERQSAVQSVRQRHPRRQLGQSAELRRDLCAGRELRASLQPGPREHRQPALRDPA